MRLLLIIPMAIIEILLLGLCWVVSYIHPRTADKLARWSVRVFPDKYWYYK